MDVPLSPEPLFFNGIHGRTGDYLLAPADTGRMASAITGMPIDVDRQTMEQHRWDQVEDGVQKAIAGVDDTDLAQAGWGVVFSGDSAHADEVHEIRDALSPLLDHRQATASKQGRYREYSDLDGYRGGRAVDWMSYHQTGTGSADPDQMPFYLLIVGSPDHIPFDFQYRLDLQRAVGRIWFDQVDHYRTYAEAVVSAESEGHVVPRRLSLFGPRNEGDAATALSATRLIAPLAEKLRTEPLWEVESIAEEAATKTALVRLVGGDEPPGLLFTASHGVGFDRGDELQEANQGALVCQDWGGRGQPISSDHYFAADDVTTKAQLHGRMAFFFACYGAGTPKDDDFAHRLDPTVERQIADQAFLAALPRRLLAHQSGGMLAVAGHIDRAWSYSFNWGRAGSQVAVFEATLRQLMNGKPIGVAFDDFNVRAAELAFDQAQLMAKALKRDASSYPGLAGAWSGATDARNYVILGDPAVRLQLG